MPGEFWGSLASGSRKRGGIGGWGWGWWKSRVRGALWLGWALPSSDSRAPDGGTAPPLQRPSRFLLPRPARGETYNRRGGRGSVGLRGPALREATGSLCPTAAPLQRPSPPLPPGLASNPSFASALLAPGFLGSGLSNSEHTLRSQSISSPELFLSPLLYPQTCNFPRLQTPSASAAAPQRDPSHLPAPGNCRGWGGCFFHGGRLWPRCTEPLHHCMCVECVFLPGAPTLPGSCVWYTEAMATAPPHPSSRKPCDFLFVPLQLSLLLADLMVRGCPPGGSSVTGVHPPCPACPLCTSLWGQGPPLAPSE